MLYEVITVDLFPVFVFRFSAEPFQLRVEADLIEAQLHTAHRLQCGTTARTRTAGTIQVGSSKTDAAADVRLYFLGRIEVFLDVEHQHSGVHIPRPNRRIPIVCISQQLAASYNFV